LRFPPSGFSFLHNAQVSESSLATARSLLLGFSIAYFRPRMFPPSIHPLGFLLSTFSFLPPRALGLLLARRDFD
jgi:hypothetical protein